MSNIQSWLYLDENKEHHGPFSPDELTQLVEQNKIQRNTYVWTEVLTDWIPAEQVEGLFPLPPAAVAVAEEQNSMSFTVPLERDNKALKRKTIDVAFPMAPKPSTKENKNFPQQQVGQAKKKASLPVSSAEQSIGIKKEKPMIDPLNLPAQPRSGGDITSNRVGDGIQCGTCGTITKASIADLPNVLRCSEPSCKASLYLPEEKCPPSQGKSLVVLIFSIVVAIGLLFSGLKAIALIGALAVLGGGITFFYLSLKKQKQMRFFNQNIRKQISQHEAKVARIIATK